mmetsp:Transcript_22265/g.72163  ORF Transcript_22265/g.72163 Transcript_22265/m.72163 type:complete len:331 (-) Transcript_22265:783-1775(-)
MAVVGTHAAPCRLSGVSDPLLTAGKALNHLSERGPVHRVRVPASHDDLHEALDGDELFARDVRAEALHRRALRSLHGIHVRERRLPRHELVRNHRKRVHVHGRPIHLVPEHLRRHVPVGPRLARHCVPLPHLLLAIDRLREPKVPNLEHLVLVKHEIRGFEVAVDDWPRAMRVQVRESAGAVKRDFDGAAQAHRQRLREHRRQGPARHVLRHDPVKVGRLTEPEELHDVRVVQLHHQLHLGLELRHGRAIHLQALVQNLDAHVRAVPPRHVYHSETPLSNHRAHLHFRLWDSQRPVVVELLDLLYPHRRVEKRLLDAGARTPLRAVHRRP